MTDDQVLAFVRFVIFRFFGGRLNDLHLINALSDFKKREGIDVS